MLSWEHIGLVGSFGVLLVGCLVVCCAGCISQDTYLLYYGIFQLPHTKINCYWWRLLLMIVIGCFSTEGSFLGGGSLWPQWSNVHFLLSAPWLITSDVLCILCLCLHCYVFVFVYLIKCSVPNVLTMIDHQVVGDGGCNPSNGHPRPIWTRAPASQRLDHLWTTVIPLSGMICLWPLLGKLTKSLNDYF